MNSYLKVRLGERSGQTRLLELEAGGSLKIARPFPLKGGGLELCLMDASPGILSGDVYDLNFAVGTGAKARVTTQGFTRVHPTRSDDLSELQTRLTLESGAHLEWFPGPIIPFAHANLRSQTRVALARGARLFLFDSWGAGRIARGEAWEFERFTSHIEMRDEDGPFFVSRFLWQKNELLSPLSPAAFEKWKHTGMVVCAGDFHPLSQDKGVRVSRETQSEDCEIAFSPLERRGHVFLLRSGRAQSLECAARALIARMKIELA